MIKAGLSKVRQNPCIMVVDDEQEILRLVSLILELEGYDVVAPSDSNSVFSLIQEYMPDLIVLDIMMPKPDGFQILKLIRQHSNTPVIVLTGRCEAHILEKALALGANDYVKKPFRTSELTAHIRKNLRPAKTQVTQSNTTPVLHTLSRRKT